MSKFKILKLKQFFILIFCVATVQNIVAQQVEWLNEYNVVWNSQSKNSSESMPCGGGDIGMNVWVENGDLLLYIDRSGNIDENDQLLKNGRVRIHMKPSPFSKDGNDVKFKQKLDLKSGAIYIEGETPNNKVNIRVWVEVYKPLIHVELESSVASKISTTFESWRNEKQLIPNSNGGSGGGQDYNRWACYGYVSYKGDVFSYPDSVFYENDNKVLFYHQNGKDRIFDKEVKLQRLDGVMDKLYHPTKNRIFGGVMFGENLTRKGNTEGKYTNTPFKGWQLKSIKALKEHHVQIMLHTEQNESIAAWNKNLEKQLKISSAISLKKKWSKNKVWWNKFWNRSYVIINKGKGNKDIGWQVGRNYQLMRYMLGCNAYGEFPTHFNGGFFIYDHFYVDGKKGLDPSFYNADYRKWGAWTGMNQRLIHWPFLKSGDFEEMMPQFNFYKRNLINTQLRNKVSWGIKGCSFGEQVGSGGLPNGYHYGWEAPFGNRKSTAEVGMQQHHRHYFHTQLEFAFMMHEWYKYTGADISEYIPFMKDAVVFHFEYHKMLQKRRNGNEWGEDGKLVLKGMQSTETYKPGENPSLEIAGLNKNIEALLSLPNKWVSEKERKKFKEWKERIPDLEFRIREGHKTIAPLAKGNFGFGNREIPQLYPVFPYGMYGLGLPNLEVGINTWKYGLDKATAKYIIDMHGSSEVYPQKEEWWGWGQQAIFLARLGLTKEAKEYVSKKLGNAQGDPWSNPKPSRFPAFWGPGYGCMPDLEWGTSGMIAIQEMLLQTISNNGKDIRILPAWPKDWEVDFKLHAPQKTTVECTFKNGKINKTTVLPAVRKKDVVF